MPKEQQARELVAQEQIISLRNLEHAQSLSMHNDYNY